MMSSVHSDILIIGGGIIGHAVAYEALRRDLTVTLLCSGETGSATAASAGMLAPASEAAVTESVLCALALASCEAYPGYVQQLESQTGRSCGYRDEGSLLVALHSDHVAALEHLQRAQDKLGLRSEWLEAKDVRQREPWLSPRQVGALSVPWDRQVNPRLLVGALATAIEQSGGRVLLGAQAKELRYDAGGVRGVRVQLPGHHEVALFDASRVVLACGAWSNEALSDIPVYPLRPVKGQALRLRGASSVDTPLLRHVVRTPDVYIVPREGGELYVGASCEEEGFDDSTTAGAMMDLLLEAWRAIPGIYELRIEETLCGFRPALRDNLPAIGATDVEGLFVATGHYRHGVMLAPMTAKLLLDCISSNKTPAALEPFSPLRFQ